LEAHLARVAWFSLLHELVKVTRRRSPSHLSFNPNWPRHATRSLSWIRHHALPRVHPSHTPVPTNGQKLPTPSIRTPPTHTHSTGGSPVPLDNHHSAPSLCSPLLRARAHSRAAASENLRKVRSAPSSSSPSSSPSPPSVRLRFLPRLVARFGSSSPSYRW
jgi:hypothetical protein